MSDMTERYEAEAEAFYKATGVMAPGKDSPAAMGGYDADELRHKLWRMWARAVYAERERDEARRQRDALEMSLAKKAESYRAPVLAAEAETKQWKEFFYGQCDKAERMEQERDQFASMLHDCENERDGWKHRAERAERVVEAAKAYREEWDSDGFEYVAHVALLDAIRALDAEAQP